MHSLDDFKIEIVEMKQFFFGTPTPSWKWGNVQKKITKIKTVKQTNFNQKLLFWWKIRFYSTNACKSRKNDKMHCTFVGLMIHEPHSITVLVFAFDVTSKNRVTLCRKNWCTWNDEMFFPGHVKMCWKCDRSSFPVDSWSMQNWIISKILSAFLALQRFATLDLNH